MTCARVLLSAAHAGRAALIGNRGLNGSGSIAAEAFQVFNQHLEDIRKRLNGCDPGGGESVQKATTDETDIRPDIQDVQPPVIARLLAERLQDIGDRAVELARQINMTADQVIRVHAHRKAVNCAGAKRRDGEPQPAQERAIDHPPLPAVKRIGAQGGT